MFYKKITSSSNALIKALRRAASGDEHDSALVEGPKLLREALEFGIDIQAVCFTEYSLSEHEDILSSCEQGGISIALVPDKLLASVCDVKTAQGIAALVSSGFVSLKEFKLGTTPLLAVADGIQDPGNIGAIARSAAAFGLHGMLLLPGCANPFSPKAVRGSAGACLRLDIAQVRLDEMFAWMSDNGISAAGLDSRGTVDLAACDFKKPCAIIVGNEGSGLSAEILQRVVVLVRIPTDPGIESLNTAVAASITFFEAVQQRQEPAK